MVRTRWMTWAAAVAMVFVVGACGGDDSSPLPAKTEFRTFVTAVNPNGDIKTAGTLATAIASADKLCTDDANKPNASVYKAMLVDGVLRRACTSPNCATGGTSEHLDWVFKPNAKYFRSDGTTLVFTAGANGVFDFGAGGNTNLLSASFQATSDRLWTGLDWNWTSVPSQMCGGSWSSASSGVAGDCANLDRTNAAAIGGCAVGCDATSFLLCVEQ